MKPEVILYDIEGTVGPVSFVKEVMFPLAAAELPAYLRSHEEELAAEIAEVREVSGDSGADLDAVTTSLLDWLKEDRKVTALKTIQGKIWQAAFEDGRLKGRIYKDAYDALARFSCNGLLQAVYSSGSVLAQKMYFRYSEHGDLTAFFAAHFDTTIGSKKEASSYTEIARRLGKEPGRIVFYSDIVEELQAARQATLQTVHIVRAEDGTAECGWQPTLHDFTEA